VRPPAGGTPDEKRLSLADAPVAIVIYRADKPASAAFDAGLACANLSTAAGALGLTTKIVSSPTVALNGKNQAAYHKRLGVPDGFTAEAVLLIGYPADKPTDTADATSAASTREPLSKKASWID
jgi:hypothetical protein